MNTENGEKLEDKLTWVKFSGANWHPDGTGFYYSRLPEVSEENKFEAENKNSKFQDVGSDIVGADLVKCRSGAWADISAVGPAIAHP